ncbi:uncharacterized protein EAF02_006627 [Botrytis sinoallii]|uniref:uncharacterized protein n=1 Tax=Botrytis sinoallii TaxID=1463999 RepID=UPI0019000773|nr:uncharacterized protein EAF02_006627 [Botrytis sinoallii]KAF7881939.1 hypothetical protein EAF02_006627 [Botrytis sinoallii]
MSSSTSLRREVIGIYKELLNLGRSYPLGYTYFRTRLHRAFMSNSHLTTAAEIRAGIERAAFVRKEIEALYVTSITSLTLPHYHIITLPHRQISSSSTQLPIVRA